MKYAHNFGWSVGRLEGTWIVHNGRFCYVRGGQDNEYYLEDKDGGRFQVNFRDVELKPPKLGYLNHSEDEGGAASYLTRAHYRRDWKQGVRPSNVAQWANFKGLRAARLDGRRNFWALEKVINKEYPTLPQALDKVEERADSVAFSPDFAVTSKGVVVHKGVTKVGSFSFGDNAVILEKPYLRESLTEQTNGMVNIGVV